MLFPPKPVPFHNEGEFGKELVGIPGINQLARVVSEEAGKHIVLEVNLSYGPIVKRVASVLKARNKKKVQLDGFNLQIFDLIDGINSVLKIIDILKDRHQLSFLESRGLCLYYLQIMAGNGIIAIGIPQKQDDVTDKK